MLRRGKRETLPMNLNFGNPQEEFCETVNTTFTQAKNSVAGGTAGPGGRRMLGNRNTMTLGGNNQQFGGMGPNPLRSSFNNQFAQFQ